MSTALELRGPPKQTQAIGHARPHNEAYARFGINISMGNSCSIRARDRKTCTTWISAPLQFALCVQIHNLNAKWAKMRVDDIQIALS